MTDETNSESVDAANYEDIQAEVDARFNGDWQQFLKALHNPGEVLHFVLKYRFDKDKAEFEAWAEDKGFPADWVPRFYSMLTPDGELESIEPMN